MGYLSLLINNCVLKLCGTNWEPERFKICDIWKTFWGRCRVFVLVLVVTQIGLLNSRLSFAQRWWWDVLNVSGMPWGAPKGYLRKLCAFEEEFAPLAFWYPSHCIPEQSHLRGATTLLPLICSSLLGPAATLALGTGTWSGSTRQFLLRTTEIHSRMRMWPQQALGSQILLETLRKQKLFLLSLKMVRYRTGAPGRSPCGETEASTEEYKAIEVLLISFSTCVQPYVKLCTFRILKAPPHHLFSKVLWIGFHPLQPKRKFFLFEVFNREILQPTMKMCGHLPQGNHISEEFLIMYGFTFTFWWYLCSVSNKATSPSKPRPPNPKTKTWLTFSL